MPVDEPDIASLDEVRQAIERLTAADLLRLKSYATWRMRALGEVARGKDHEDLLQESMAATLDSRRSWRKDVDFVHHLVRTMESISNGWGRRMDFGEKLEADLHPADPDEETEDPLGAARPTRSDQESQAIALQQLDRLRAGLAKDHTAVEVLGGMLGDMSGPDIMQALGISETEMRSAQRKIRRHLQALLDKSQPGFTRIEA